MTWGELKAALEAAGVPDDAEILLSDGYFGNVAILELETSNSQVVLS